jgi:tRNA A37 threonylcarbamoyltransferase TsaD
MDMSFSGLLTAISNEFRSGKHSIADLCFSLQETGYAMLGEVTERALAHTKKPELLLTGGVGANKRLRSVIKEIAEEQGTQPCYVPISLATDNGAMIAWTGIIAYENGVRTPIETSYVDPRWRLDVVEIPWRLS